MFQARFVGMIRGERARRGLAQQRTALKRVVKTLPLALTNGRRRSSFPLWKRIKVGSCFDVDDVFMLYLASRARGEGKGECERPWRCEGRLLRSRACMLLLVGQALVGAHVDLGKAQMPGGVP